MLGFIFNLDRDTFKDPRVREAFNLAFPFEDINKSLFYGQYIRLGSYFDGIPLAAKGLPEGPRAGAPRGGQGQVPPEVFTEAYKNPDNGTPTKARNNLRAALKLLDEAGWKLEDNKAHRPRRQADDGRVPDERAALREDRAPLPAGARQDRHPARDRPVDTSQYENRVRSRDFDIMYTGWAQSMSPGNEQIEYFGSASADREGSRNYGAIKNPAVDTLIRKIIMAPDRDELIAATKALDRVLLWNQYLVPGWTLREARVARWDRYGHPEPLPEYSIGFPTIWWWDAAGGEGGRAK